MNRPYVLSLELKHPDGYLTNCLLYVEQEYDTLEKASGIFEELEELMKENIEDK